MTRLAWVAIHHWACVFRHVTAPRGSVRNPRQATSVLESVLPFLSDSFQVQSYTWPWFHRRLKEPPWRTKVVKSVHLKDSWCNFGSEMSCFFLMDTNMVLESLKQTCLPCISAIGLRSPWGDEALGCRACGCTHGQARGGGGSASGWERLPAREHVNKVDWGPEGASGFLGWRRAGYGCALRPEVIPSFQNEKRWFFKQQSPKESAIQM